MPDDPLKKPTCPMPKMLWWLSFLAIVGAIIGGLFLTGGPFHQRKLKMDARRVEDLNRLSTAIGGYYREKKTLPSNLNAVRPYLKDKDKDVSDPDTGEAYVYKPTGEQSFHLCATFETDSDSDRDRLDYRYSPNINPKFEADHPAGYHCFQLEKDPTVDPEKDKGTSAPPDLYDETIFRTKR